jgi:hypothetical protein
MELKWEDPSIGRPSKIDHAGIAKALRERPNLWAIVHEFAMEEPYWKATLLGQFVKGNGHAYRPAGTFEAAVRTVGNVRRVYARYVEEAK